MLTFSQILHTACVFQTSGFTQMYKVNLYDQVQLSPDTRPDRILSNT